MPGAGAGGEAGNAEVVPQFTCDEAEAEPLPARRAITSNDAPAPPDGGDQIITVTKQSLFKEFEKQTCGTDTCHGGADLPLLQSPDAFMMTLDSFDQRPELGTEALARILSSDEDLVMPPGSGDGSKRGPNDPVRRLGERLLAWQEAGFPDSFEITISGEPVDPELPADPYLLSPSLGNKLTNLGSCIPRQKMLSPELDEMEDKDLLFASIESSEELPDIIFETDLVSLDSTALARRRVFSYAPTYPLFSDHAGKMRHVRVPSGETITYDPETNDFNIPDNTRFYKTFLKPVRDKDGNVGYRKMETRLIVVRRDERLPDGTYRPRALRAAYAWDKDERMARRVTDPFRDGKPAADRLCAYVVDESVTRDPGVNPISDEVSETCTYMTEAEMQDPDSGQVRHYAIPSTERCDQCHMGSNNHSYILGFSPWQVDRRPDGEGGVYEAPKPDELSQLQRLIEYGVISGIQPGQAKLEESQGPRKPRNDYELTAQAYMIGNCAFCHNPNGFPVVTNPVLRDFDLYPSEAGGVFEFSLERYSPRAKAGKAQQVRYPYITPAFGDHALGQGSEEVIKTFETADPLNLPVLDGSDLATADKPPDLRLKFTGSSEVLEFEFLGPWRSLIWRNVYTPFTYTEDSTIFIHMPRNVAGFDCRAPTIFANWMLSIPSIPKSLDQREEQPMREVRERSVHPDDYPGVVAAARKRVEAYARSVTGAQCPIDDDIVDPKVILSPIQPNSTRKERSAPADDQHFSSPRVNHEFSGFNQMLDHVPDHAHWVSVDTTDAPGKWVPRRSNWESVIVTRNVNVADKLGAVIDHLQSVHLTPEFEAFASEPLPMGLWEPECATRPEASGSPTGGELLANDPLDTPLHRWLAGAVFDDVNTVRPEARVHLQSPGEAVFRQICQNCHGANADSKSPLAATILELTGGQTRVANFVDGIFGPPSAPLAFARDEFLIDQGATWDDWQLRYMLFMGLGGTQAELPAVALNLVATSPFYGKPVTAPGVASANMLEAASGLCFKMLGVSRILPDLPRLQTAALAVPFALETGHYELWESLCSMDNEPVVRVFELDNAIPVSNAGNVYRARDDAGVWIYPPDRRVGTHSGSVELGITSSNLLPWCFRLRHEGQWEKILFWASERELDPTMAPICPEELFATALGAQVHQLALSSDSSAPDYDGGLGNQTFTERWARHGAINAGKAAYHYLRGMLSGQLAPSVPFNFCRE